ncbi:MAG: hypothetical protein KDC44_21540, partial [Phaeodactylibacter sp.]|nr:hypothetical protein [Phaeodactylibacter sp.]
MMTYLPYTAFLIALFYLFYQYLLKDETFFGLHRWWLLLCMGLAFLVPLLQVPAAWSLRTAEVQEAAKETSLPAFHQQPDYLMVDPAMPAAARPSTIAEPFMETQVEAAGFWADWTLADGLRLLYLLGLGIFVLNFLIQLVALLWQVWTRPTLRDGRFVIVELDGDKAPFSFWNFIFINPSKYDWETYQDILDHEKIHVNKRHSLDILLAEALVILQWFNPFAWRYRRAVENNLEFSTDSSMLRKGTDPQRYQLNLLKVAVPNIPLNLTTNYNQSILKRRIMMMNAKRSSIRSSWKYFFLVPLIGLSVLCFNTPLVSGQQPDTATDAALDLAYQEPETTARDQPSTSEAWPKQVPAVQIHAVEWTANGNWSGELNGNEVCIFLKHKSSDGDHHWGNTECFQRSALSNLPIGKEGTFTLKGEAGTITFKGRFDGNEGKGSYSFEGDSGFKQYLEGAGFKEVNDGTLLALCFGQMGKSDVDYLLAQKFPSLDTRDLEAVASVGLDKQKIEYYKKGFSALGFDQLTLDELLGLSIHEVDMEYVKELGDLVYQDMSIENVIAASIHEVDPEYIKAFQAAGFKDLSFDNLIAAAIHEVDPNYIKEFQAAGFKDLDF